MNIEQENKIEIVKINGELKLVHQKIDTIKDNHLAHLDARVNSIYKILWIVLATGLAQIFGLVRSLL
jgi:hypothetical protein|tara:strand:+ start:784 stop:984 length:201 start_codon:yes stop_codon:yes gene_type:complete